MQPHRRARIRAARLQSLVVLAVLATVAVLCVWAEILAINPHRAYRVETARREHCRKSGRPFYNRGYFRDWGERVLLDELPTADYSKGGVYLFGSSPIVGATEFWRLPPAYASRIHNFGFESTEHTSQFAMLRFLVERQNLFQAGSDKNLIVFALSFYGIMPESGLKSDFEELVTRQGLYRFTPEREIETVTVSPTYRTFCIEKARISGALREALIDMPLRLFEDRLSIGRWRQSRCEDHQKVVDQRLGPKWESTLETQITEFSRTLDYLQDRQITVQVVLWPLSPCDADLPYAATYNQKITELCRAKDVPIFDWSALLDDNDFSDHIHTNVGGAEKVHQAVMGMTSPFLDALIWVR